MERGCAREHRSQVRPRARERRGRRRKRVAFAAGVFDSAGVRVFREHMRSSRPLTRSADRAARLARLDITTVLPAELLVWIAGSLSPKDLCRVACTHSMWREAVAIAAEHRVREYLRTTLVLEASPCWLRSLAQIERLTAAVGSRPEHGWRQEWKAMKISAAKLSFMTGGREWKAEYEADFDDGGVLSLEREIELSRPQCLLAPELHGCWDEEAALYVTSIAGGEESLILCEAFEQRTAVFAALLHAELSAYSSAACVAAAQSELLAASQREVEELRAALAVEREKAEAAAADVASQRAAAQEAADRASSSEESLQAAASREAAARRLLAQQVSQQLKSLGKIATHLAPTSAVS